MTTNVQPMLCKCSLCSSVMEKKFMKTPKRKGYEKARFCPECYDNYLEFHNVRRTYY